MATESVRPLEECFKSLFRSSQSIEYAIVDAFVGENCKGNPAAVVLLSEWKDNKWLQDVAAEFNLSETAFLVKTDKKLEKGRGGQRVGTKGDLDTKNEPDQVINEYDLRWFTPVTEVNLCGHATLAAAHLLYHSGLVNKKNTIFFRTKGGLLSTRYVQPKESDAQSVSSGGIKTAKEGLIEMDFPWIPTTSAEISDIAAIRDSIHTVELVSLRRGMNYLIIELETREYMDTLQPNMQELLKCETDGLIAIAPGGKGSGFDYVSRCFYPKYGINEDPVTGSAHCILGPYWATQHDKYDLIAHQVSKRGGIVALHMDKKMGRVSLSGLATITMAGVLVQ